VATNYERGRAFEYRARDKALKMGAVYVMRAAQSKGKADLFVLWHEDWYGGTQVWLVQCKRDGRLPRAEREAILAIAAHTGVTPVLAKTGKNGRGVEFINLHTNEEIT